MSEMLIGEVAQKTGIATSAIRYYEEIGLLPNPTRINGRRRYDSDVIQHLTIIRAAQNASWSLAEIKELFLGFPDHASLSERWKAQAPRKIIELESIIGQTQKTKQLLESTLDCTCTNLEGCTLVA